MGRFLGFGENRWFRLLLFSQKYRTPGFGYSGFGKMKVNEGHEFQRMGTMRRLLEAKNRRIVLNFRFVNFW